MRDFLESEAKQRDCRMVPPVVMPGAPGLDGRPGLQIIFHPCAASGCMHWHETQGVKKNALDARFDEEARGVCSINRIFANPKGAT